jgi:multimeric flavodoxin WrbA
MKNILVLNGAARKNGNTAQLLEAFIEGAKSAGHSVESFYLQSMDIHGCTGCEGCKKMPKGCDNPCVQNDDMANIYPYFIKADVIVFMSPYYFWGITGPLKTATDRLYAVINNLGLKNFKKESVLLMTAGAPDFSKAISWYERFESYLGWKNHGMVLGSGKTEEAKRLGNSI